MASSLDIIFVYLFVYIEFTQFINTSEFLAKKWTQWESESTIEVTEENIKNIEIIEKQLKAAQAQQQVVRNSNAELIHLPVQERRDSDGELQ